MPHARRVLRIDAEPISTGLDAIADEFDLPVEFDDLVVAEATAARADSAGPTATARTDATHLPLVAIDPEGSTDLDQAFHVERSSSGFVLHYCIADLGAFIAPGGAIDTEANQRGETIYLPSRRVPLHPKELSEGTASLLADGNDRPAIWWRIAFDADGTQTGVEVQRATVRNRRAISYPEAQSLIDGGGDEQLSAMKALGIVRIAQEVARGGVSLSLPEQEVDVDGDGVVTLHDRAPLDVELWNAQLSLATGMAAAQLMLDGGVGLLRTMPAPDEFTLTDLRRVSAALHVPFPETMTYPEWVRALDPTTPVGASLMQQASRGLRGAGYTVFNGEIPELSTHSAVAAPYAHVTAPLRRLCDRYANEIVLSLAAGTPIPEWASVGAAAMPDTMAASGRHAKAVERAVIDLVEAAVLQPHVGDEFDAVVITKTERGSVISIPDPPVIAMAAKVRARPGDEIRLRLSAVDVAARTVTFDQLA